MLAVLLFAAVAASAQNVKVYKIGDLLKRINNSSDTIYVVNFWATWCKPCVEELPDLEAFSGEAKKNVKVLLVTLDFKEDLDSKVIPFLKKNKYTMECVLLDEVNGNDFINKIDPKWGGAIPTTVFTTGNKKKQNVFEKKITLSLLNSTLNGF
ncbi:MAG: TlpA disulfide reductase family protein [Bacteroidia bacterium]